MSDLAKGQVDDGAHSTLLGDDLSDLAVRQVDDGADCVDEGSEDKNWKPPISGRRNQLGSQRTADNA